MRTPTTRLLVAAALLAAVGVAGCGDESEPADRRSDATPTTAPTATQDPEARFLTLTAEHVCEVQSEVYPDAAALAKAYDTAPDYPGLSAGDVRDLERRLETDDDLARRLNDEIAETCGGTPPES